MKKNPFIYNPEHAQLFHSTEIVNLPGAQLVSIDVSTNVYPHERSVIHRAKLQQQVAAGLKHCQFLTIEDKNFADFLKTGDNTNKQKMVASLILRKISPELLSPGTTITINVDGTRMMLIQQNFELEKHQKTETTNKTRLRRQDDDYGSFDIVTKSTIYTIQGTDEKNQNETLINKFINKIQDKIFDGYALEEYISNPLKLINDLQLSKEELFELSLVNCDLEMRFESLGDENYEQISFNTKDLYIIIEGLKEINIEKYTKPEVIVEVEEKKIGILGKIMSIFKIK